MGGEHVNVRLVVCEFYQRTGNLSVGTREYTAMQDTCNTLEGHFSARNPTKLGVTNHTNEASTGFCRASFFFFFLLASESRGRGLGLSAAANQESSVSWTRPVYRKQTQRDVGKCHAQICAERVAECGNCDRFTRVSNK